MTDRDQTGPSEPRSTTGSTEAEPAPNKNAQPQAKQPLDKQPPSAGMTVVNRATARQLPTPHGTIIRPLIDRSTSSITQCSLAEEVLPPGFAVKPHYHKTHEEIYYLRQGHGRMRVGDDWREVASGDAIYIPVNQVHSLENTGPTDIILVVIVGPAFSFDDVFEEATS